MQLLGMGLENGKKIKHYHYQHTDLLGKGNFSRVYKAVNTKTQEQVALKIVSLDALRAKKLQHLVTEQINILKRAEHPNIIKFHEAIFSERSCYIVTELCKEGNLEDRVKKKKKNFSDEELNSIIIDIYQGLRYLRQIGVCHRDIKAANIFLCKDRAKIADFGLAKFYKQRFADLDIGSPLYMSPQGLIQNVYSDKTDIWAFGITIYELLHLSTPFINCKSQEQLKKMVTRPIPQSKFKNNIKPEMKQLIRWMLTIDEYRRPSVYDLQQHQIIKNRLQPKTMIKKKTSRLNLVQTSRTSSGNKTKEEQPIQTKIIELGGSKIKNKKVVVGQSQMLNCQASTTLDLTGRKTLFANFIDPKQLIRNKINSIRTTETRESEEDRNLLNRQRGYRSHLH